MRSKKCRYKCAALVSGLLLICSSCKTYHMYLSDHSPVCISFTRETKCADRYQYRDSVFIIASKEAMRRALER